MAKLLLQELGAVDINVNKQASPTTAASKQDSGSAAGVINSIYVQHTHTYTHKWFARDHLNISNSTP